MSKETKIQVVYGSFSFYTTIINSLFILYHVDVYVKNYKIDKTSFWIGETIFMIWNSVNDPLFAWLSDSTLLAQKHTMSYYQVCSKRIQQLNLYGPLLALTFMLIWIPLLSTSYLFIQLTLSLCLYDTFLTIVDLQYSSLLADLEISSTKRARFNYYSAMFSSFAAFSVFISYFIWSTEVYFNFQLYCFFVTLFTFFGYQVSSRILQSLISQQSSTPSIKNHSDEELSSLAGSATSTKLQLKWNFMKYMKLFPTHRNLMLFCILNFIQVFSCNFSSNFFPLFLDSLLSNNETRNLIGSTLLGLSFLFPHILNMYLLGLCEKYGTYLIIKFIFFLKLFIAFFMFYFGQSNQLFVCLFIISNRIFTEGTCKLLNLIVADLIDEDYVINHRFTAISALIFGTTSFLAKPGQTLAPLVGTNLITSQTGVDVFDTKTSEQYNHDIYRDGCFKILVMVPIICGVVQIFVWEKFDLHSKKLKLIKEKRASNAFGNSAVV